MEEKFLSKMEHSALIISNRLHIAKDIHPVGNIYLVFHHVYTCIYRSKKIALVFSQTLWNMIIEINIFIESKGMARIVRVDFYLKGWVGPIGTILH